MSMITNRKDLDFLLYDVVDIVALSETPRYAAYDRSSVSAMLDAAQAIAETVYLPCAVDVDAAEPQFVNGTAVTHPAVKPALEAYADAGFFAAGFDEKDGGLQMPTTVLTAVNGMFSCANLSIHNYATLTIAAAHVLVAFGSPEQRSTFVPPMLDGRWFGTMCLSETQAGSSLSDIRTRAAPIAGNRFAITGTKMWISGGDQDITENIVHLVLARLPDSPAGVKGLSLFIVPKFRIDDLGRPVVFNNVTLAGLNHKLGNRGTTNTLLNFGEAGTSEGWMVGEPNQGLKYMFHMMNEARIAIGHGACMLGLAGFLYSLDYARTRTQGRLPSMKDPISPQVPIIQHADVRRLLLAQKAAVEGGMALVLYCASLVDAATVCESETDRRDLALLLDLLTPVAKSWPSEFCLEANKHAIQILGGYGYARDYPTERFYRDNRLNPIHEGTHAIHGLDILGRKVRIQDGAALEIFALRLRETIAAAAEHISLIDFARGLEAALDALVATTEKVLAAKNIDLQLANATLYLDAFGHISVGWLWLKQGLAATRLLACQSPDTAFLVGKLQTMRYFHTFELPRAANLLSVVASLDDTSLGMQVDSFTGA